MKYRMTTLTGEFWVESVEEAIRIASEKRITVFVVTDSENKALYSEGV